jgi:hypothetical protein
MRSGSPGKTSTLCRELVKKLGQAPLTCPHVLCKELMLLKLVVRFAPHAPCTAYFRIARNIFPIMNRSDSTWLRY